MKNPDGKIISCALNFCDFYPLVEINPASLAGYLGSFVDHSKSVSIPFFLSDFLMFLESGVHASGSNIIGASLDIHKKCLTSYPISLIIDEKSIDDSLIEKIGPFTIVLGSLSLDDISIRHVVVFDYSIDSCIEQRMNSVKQEFDIRIDNYDKFIKSSNKKEKYKINLPKLNINTTISANSKEKALQEALSGAWDEFDDKKFYKRKPSIFLLSTYSKDNDILNDIVKDYSNNKTADASSSAGPDTSWSEGTPIAFKYDDYGSGMRDLPSVSWLGRKARFRSINESAVDNDGVIIYDKNNIIKIKKSNGNIVKLKKNDPNLFFTIELI
tara:strand:- start:125 stop:1105 length:981 start_codon:yes stop_codon:yes gene_type:complete